MGKGITRRKKQTFNYNKNRRRAWKKSKQLPRIECAQLRHAWDEKKSLERNLSEMGLSADPNKTLAIPRGTALLKAPKTLEEIESMNEEYEDSKVKKRKIMKQDVVPELEKEANQEFERTFQLPPSEVKYCVYMMEKYGDDYKAMARDAKNHYQETPKQIRKKINTFKGIPAQYNAYLASKEDKT